MEVPTKNMFHKTNCQTVSSIGNSSTLAKNTLRKAMYLMQAEVTFSLNIKSVILRVTSDTNNK